MVHWWVLGHSSPNWPFILVGAREGLFFEVVFELWCGEWAIHYSLCTWTVHSCLSIFWVWGVGGGQSKEFPSL